MIELGIKVELLGVTREERLAGVGDADDLNVSAMQVVLEESFDVAVDESDDGNAQRRHGGLGCAHASGENDGYKKCRNAENWRPPEKGARKARKADPSGAEAPSG